VISHLRLLAAAAAAAFLLAAGWGTGVGSAQTPCADLGGTVNPAQECFVHVEEPGYRYEFSFPVNYPDQQAVADYLTRRRDEFVDYVKTLPPPSAVPYELEVNGKGYSSGSPETGTASMVLTAYSETGAAHPVTHYKGFDFDLGKGAPITFDTLFKPGSAPLDVVYPAVLRQFTDRFGQVSMYGGRDPKTYQNFAITDAAVIFFFGQGQVLSQVDGPIEIRVPRTELAQILAL
jgi:hypothetical protein